MIFNARRRVSKGNICIVSKSHDPGSFEVMMEKVLKPESLRLRICPRVREVTIQSMDCDDIDSEGLLARLIWLWIQNF